jgi:hypothetical protein
MNEVLAHTIAEVTKISGLGRSTIYEAIGNGQLDARKAGNRTLIVATSLRSFLDNLPPATIRTGRKAARSLPQQVQSPRCGRAPGRLRKYKSVAALQNSTRLARSDTEDMLP